MEIVAPHLRVLKALENAQSKEEIEFSLKHCRPCPSSTQLLFINIHNISLFRYVIRGIKKVFLICANILDKLGR